MCISHTHSSTHTRTPDTVPFSGHVLQQFQAATSANSPDECISVTSQTVERNLFTRAAIDLQYLLRTPKVAAVLLKPSSLAASPKHRGETAWAGLMLLLRRMQMVDATRREVSSHVIFETNSWKHAYHLIFRFMPLVDLACTAIYDHVTAPGQQCMVYSESKAVKAMRACTRELISWMQNR